MARTDSRGGPQTRSRIAAVASGLFAEHGFEAVTVAEVARAAGVSTVTVFKHFPKKEDLFLDRSAEAADMLRSAVRNAGAAGGLAHSLRNLLAGLLDQRHPFSGTDERSVSFFRTVAQSPTLLACARRIATDMQATLESELDNTPEFTGDPALLAAFFVAGYGRVLCETARRLMAGEPHTQLVDGHRLRIEGLLDALQVGALTAT